MQSRFALGTALLIAATGLTIWAYLRLVERARRRDGSAEALPAGPPNIQVRPLATVAVGAVGGLVRRALAFVLLASALKLLNLSTASTGLALLLVASAAPILWMLVRRRHGFPATVGRSRRRRAERANDLNATAGDA